MELRLTLSIWLVKGGSDMAEKSYPLNCWYAVGWDYEVSKGKMLARTICEKPLIFWRKSDGTAVAMDDACWHRLAPLSKGKIVKDTVLCPYHGLAFEAGGRCIHMPSQETINPAAFVRTYPLTEAHRLTWVWLGDPALSDPAKVPDLHWNADPEWAGDGKTLKLQANYLLVVDNLMDLTHETFIHSESIGNDALAEAPFEVRHGNGTAQVTRWILNEDAPPFWRGQLGKPGPTDRWQIIHFTAPSTVSLDVGVAVAGTGAPHGNRSQGVTGRITFAITPESEKTTHYFWSANRNFDIHSQSLTNIWREGVSMIFGQDEEILAAQQRAIDLNSDKVFYDLNIDAGGVWARRKVREMLDAENSQVTGVI
jgi:phenylpropionate dioxygenase-like ring-hydroxylating dioxygenase large terminal subunit